MPRMDLNGDGRTDIVLLDNNWLELRSWLGTALGGFSYNGAAGVQAWPSGTTQGRYMYAMVGVGDFNQDGRTDSLWLDFDDSIWLTLTTPSGALYSSTSWSFIGKKPIDWHIRATGDFDGDGRVDLLWMHNGSGTVTNWLGQGGTAFANNHANTGLVAPAGWFINGVGDFNGDGRDDILWRSSDASLTVWFGKANGGFDVGKGQDIPRIGWDWTIVGAGDFNGDGRHDLLWRYHADAPGSSLDGMTVTWLGQADGSFANNHAKTGTIVPVEWTVLGVGDYDGDGRDDILWRHRDGHHSNWLGQPDGGFANNHYNAAISFDPSWWVIPDASGQGWVWW